MPPANVIKVQLDRPREIRWTKRAEARNASLPRPVSFSQLAKGKNRLYVACAVIWAALVDRDHEFESPEDLAEYLTTSEQQLAVIEKIVDMVREAFPQKKSSDISSGNGPDPSSSATSEVKSTGGS